MHTVREEPDRFLTTVGECFMFLLLTETAMLDLVVLEKGGEDMQRRYSSAFGKEPHPRDFTRNRLELGKEGFSTVKKKFLKCWPQWNDHKEIIEAIERIVLWRNMLGHANVQPFRGYLLYTPTKDSLEQIEHHMRCHLCKKYLKDCGCEREDLAKPTTVKVSDETVLTIYEDIRAVDEQCLRPTAELLDVKYQGIKWPSED